MKQRGRKSSASLSVVSLIPREPRPAPAGLTASQAAVWREVVQDMPPDWFDRCPALLASYCRHVDAGNVIAKAVNATKPAMLADDEALKRYDKLLGMAARESAAAAALATRMRLTQQARYTPKSAATAAQDSSRSRPWEI